MYTSFWDRRMFLLLSLVFWRIRNIRSRWSVATTTLALVLQQYCRHCGNGFCSSCCKHKVARSAFGATGTWVKWVGSCYRCDGRKMIVWKSVCITCTCSYQFFYLPLLANTYTHTHTHTHTRMHTHTLARMPSRTRTRTRTPAPNAGKETVRVCASCYEYLQMLTSPRTTSASNQWQVVKHNMDIYIW